MSDTGPARLPGLMSVNAKDPALNNWIRAVTERLEVREGSRGNPAERVVTQRELDKLAKGVVYLVDNTKNAEPGDVLIDLGGGLTASVAIDKFIASIRDSRLYKDLLQRLDDPNRFNDLPDQVRTILLNSISEEAKKRGADIQRLETKIQTSSQSLAMLVQEVTASLGDSTAGVRELSFANADAISAQAGKITQVEASLGNYYQDGQPGRVVLEEELLASADKVDGLRGQYTLKIQAGGALAGFGLAAEEVDGVPSSAFLISADKFAVVRPSYNGGLNTNPSSINPADGGIPFGIDNNGIYLNDNVYIRGRVKIDAGKPLSYGLRGSVTLGWSGTSWSDLTASIVVWNRVGSGEYPYTNDHLVIGDTVTIYEDGVFSQTKQWMGSGWEDPGVSINGSLLVNGSIAANKINTNGLTITDASGNAVFQSGSAFKWPQASEMGLGKLATLNNINVNTPDEEIILGLGALAKVSEFNTGNINTYIRGAAIGSALIQNAAVGTLKIAGNAVSASKGRAIGVGTITLTPSGYAFDSILIDIPANAGDASFIATVTMSFYPTNSTNSTVLLQLYVEGGFIQEAGVSIDGFSAHSSTTGFAVHTNNSASPRQINITARAAVKGGFPDKELSAVGFITVHAGYR